MAKILSVTALRRRLTDEQLEQIGPSLVEIRQQLVKHRPSKAVDALAGHRDTAARLLLGYNADGADLILEHRRAVWADLGVNCRDVAVYKQVAAILDGLDIPWFRMGPAYGTGTTKWTADNDKRLAKQFDKLRAFWTKITRTRYPGLPCS